MGGGNIKAKILHRLDELDQEEFEVNLKLKELQKKLNPLLPKEKKVILNKKLTKESFEEIKRQNISG